MVKENSSRWKYAIVLKRADGQRKIVTKCVTKPTAEKNLQFYQKLLRRRLLNAVSVSIEPIRK